MTTPNHEIHMKYILALVLSLSLSACGNSYNGSETKIIGGKLAKDRNFMVGLTEAADSTDMYCGATLIKKRVVLTAAHCLEGTQEEIYVRLGNDIDADEPAILVEAVLAHPEYDPIAVTKDIAILILADYNPTALTNIATPISFNVDNLFPSEASAVSLTVVGRGNTSPLGYLYEEQLRETNIEMVNLDDCRTINGGENVNSAHICASSFETGGRDTCQGDSGGPLLAEHNGQLQLVGITSWGEECAQKGSAGVYTRVSAYKEWISTQINLYENSAYFLSGSQIDTLVRSYCFSKMNFKSNFTNSTKNLSYISTMSNSTKFDLSIPSESKGETLCEFTLLSGRKFKMELDLDEDLIVRESGSLFQWSSPTHYETYSTHLACDEPTNQVLDYSIDGYGYLEFGDLSFFFDSLASPTTPTIDTSCAFNKTGVVPKFIVHESTLNETKNYFITLKNIVENDNGNKSYIDKTFKLELEANKYQMSVAISNDMTKMTVRNISKIDIYSWKMECNFQYSLGDDMGVSYLSQLSSEYFEDEDSYAVHFVTPAHLHGILLKHQSIDFALNVIGDKPETPECMINSLPVRMLLAKTVEKNIL
jgi:trypsin